MISDRWNIEITYDDGSREVSENVTSSDKLGTTRTVAQGSSGVHSTNDPASGNNGVADYAGGEGGVASWHCSYYGYTYGPAYTGTYDGYFRDIYQYWPEGPRDAVGLVLSVKNVTLPNSVSDGLKSMKVIHLQVSHTILTITGVSINLHLLEQFWWMDWRFHLS